MPRDAKTLLRIRTLACLAVVLPAAATLAQGEGQALVFTEAAAEVGVATLHAPPVFDEPVGFMSGGGAVGDFNRDGWQDLFVVTTSEIPDRLFINNGDGTFTDQAEAWGCARTHLGIGAAVADFNNDGWLDLYVTSQGREPTRDGLDPGAHLLYLNLNGESFVEVAQSSGVNRTSTSFASGMSASWGDYDLDGDLDLAVAGWRRDSAGNRLFRNEGNGTFIDVTAFAIGFSTLLEVRGFVPRFADMNGDRYPELLWTGDFSTSRYYINNGNGSFSNATALARIGVEGNAMGSEIDFLDEDDRPDWYVTSIYDGPMDPPRPFDPPTTIDGNMLYTNQGDHQFDEVSVMAGVRDGRWGWGAAAVDFNHDGINDIAATNGWHSDVFSVAPSRLYLGNGDGTFQDIAQDCQLDHTGWGRGLLNADFDNDGDQEIVIFTNQGELAYYRNDLIVDDGSGTTPAGRHWLRVFLDTRGASTLAPDGVGAKISVTTNATTQHRLIDAGSNYLAQSELSAHFGLGSSTLVYRVEVMWPDGRLETFTDLDVNQTITIRAHPCEYDGDLSAHWMLDLLAYLTDWFDETGPQGAFDGADLNGDATADLMDLTRFIECLFQP